jgi:oxygen-dependent protoporphyrinogen oxidase
MEWAMKASDEDLIAISESQLGDLLGLYETALDVAVHRFPIGLPEYRVGHRQRVQQWREALDAHPTLALAGNYLDGVGMPDCVRSGRRAVGKLLSL